MLGGWVTSGVGGGDYNKCKYFLKIKILFGLSGKLR